MVDAPATDGRALTRTNLWRIFWISAIVSAGAAQGNRSQAVWGRLIVIGAACVIVYRGHRWALWLLGVLTVFAGLAMVVLAAQDGGLAWTLRVLLAAGGVIQVLAFVILVRAPEVREFMEAQRTGGGGPAAHS